MERNETLRAPRRSRPLASCCAVLLSFSSLVAILALWGHIIIQPRGTFLDQGGMLIMYVYLPLSLFVWFGLGGSGLSIAIIIGRGKVRTVPVLCSGLIFCAAFILSLLTLFVPLMLRQELYRYYN